MFGFYFLLILVTLSDGRVCAQSVPIKSAVRVRLSDDVFVQISRVVDFVYGRRVMQLTIPNEQECFAEGCVQIYGMRVNAQRPPTVVVVAPSPPNLLTLTIADFDLYVTASLSGQMQLVPPIPISVPAAGTLLVTAIQMELGAVLDIQKHHDDKAYVRLVSCYIRKGMVNSKVENMGLLTTIVNLKYQNQMNEKAEDVIQRTICGDIQDIIDSEFNTRVAKIPAVISIKDVAQTLLKSVAKRRHSRAVRGTTLGNVSRALIEHDRIPHAIAHIPSAARAHSIPNVASAVVSLPTNLQPVSSQLETLVLGATFNLEKLSPLILSLSILDTSATYDKFFVGINGDVYVHNHSSIRNPYTRPESLKFVTPTNGKALELLISEYTVNTLLLKAHSVGAVVFRIGSNTPVFGKLLQTTCSFDEVCLSDSVSEPGEKYPDKQLEMIVRSTKPPYIHFARDMATLHFEGRSLFYIEGTTEKVGVIPFETTMVVKARTENGRVHGTFSIPSLEYKNDVDFFDLPVDSLRGFRDANKGALLNVINAKLKEGIALELDEKSHIYNISVAFMNEAVLIQGDLSIEKLFYSTSKDKNTNYYWSRT